MTPALYFDASASPGTFSRLADLAAAMGQAWPGNVGQVLLNCSADWRYTFDASATNGQLVTAGSFLRVLNGAQVAALRVSLAAPGLMYIQTWTQ